MKKVFEIYFEDLNPAAQHYLLDTFKTTEKEENWDCVPLTVIEREMEEEE